MLTYVRRGALALAVAATVIIGGGFASAGYEEGNTATGDTVDVTYTVVSYRAIELSNSNAVAFGAVRQGSVTAYTGTGTAAPPSILYATTWTNDKIEVALNADMANGVKLYLKAGSVTVPPLDACPSGGSGGSPVTASITLASSAQPIIQSISNCGQAADVTYPTVVSGTVAYTANVTASTWISAPTLWSLDTINANDTGGTLADPVSKTVTFTIKAGA